MSIMTFVGLDMLIGLQTPKLIVPTDFKVSVNEIPLENKTGNKILFFLKLFSKAASLVCLSVVVVVVFPFQIT